MNPQAINGASAERPSLDPSSWNTEHREYLIRFALQRISDYGTAEDLVQDTFLSAWNARDRFRGDCTERTWLTGILRNKIIDHYRRNDRRPAVLTTDLESSATSEQESLSWIERQPDASHHAQPVSATERSEFMEELEDAVTRLPATMGEAYRLREIEGYSTEEITERLRISRSNLWVLIHRAKRSLGEELEGNWKNGFGETIERRAA